MALKVETTDSEDKFNVFGRGVLHLSVLIETMRREGYELQVGRPQVILKEIDGKKHEPMETLSIDVPEDVASKAVNLVSLRKGDLMIMEPKGDLIHLEFNMPSRGIIGLRTNILNVSAGEAIMAHRFLAYEPWKGDIPSRKNGTLIALETGTTIPFALNKLQDRGKFFVPPGVEIYEGQVLGEHIRPADLTINVTKTKQLTNMRTQSTDEKVRLSPPIIFSLEEAMEYIQKDEYVEVTPKSIRLRKIRLKEAERKRSMR